MALEGHGLHKVVQILRAMVYMNDLAFIAMVYKMVEGVNLLVCELRVLKLLV